MKTLVLSKEGFDIYFEAIEETIPLSELLPEETKEGLDEIYKNNEIFVAKVTAEKSGIELATDYLGGCIYENESDFYKSNDYFPDMVNTVIAEAKETIINLSKN